MHPLQVFSVSLQDVKAHLLLMAAFKHIHQKAEQAGVHLEHTTGLPIPSSHAVLFLARSLNRFESWIKTLNTDIEEIGLRDHEIPPLDVLMFLHAYMLSPLDFYEDSVSRHKVLKRVGEFPLSRVERLINKETFELKPTAEQVAHWKNVTHLPFETSLADFEPGTFAVTCPRCKNQVLISWGEVLVQSPSVPLSIAPVFPSIEFQKACATCKLDVSPSTIRTGRFLKDVYGGQIAHTILDDTGAAPDFATAKAVSLEFTTVLGPDLGLQAVGDAFGWKIERVFDHLSTHLDKGSDLIAKLADIKESYAHSSDFAINLGDAVFRQVRFIFQLSAMGWLDVGRFENDNDALVQAMRNYERLLRVNLDGMIVRWDVDLIFHTHQLSGARYRSDTLRIAGRVLDHDDKQSQDVIVRATEHAEAIWKDAFGQSYLVPQDPSIFAKMVCGSGGGGACVVKGGGAGSNGQSGGGSGGSKRAFGVERAVLVH